jgi:hypothetical protein
VTRAERLHFDGSITGLGTASGTRLVVGLWSRTPFGPIADVMVERADGHRVLLAPRAEVAEFIAATYAFDEVCIEPVAVTSTSDGWALRSPSLVLDVTLGRRTGIGRLLCLVPRPVARSPAWCRAVDPVARRVRSGVRTIGTAGGGRREFYCALDEHAVARVQAHWHGADLGELRAVTPPVRFGFASTPEQPAQVRVTTVIEPS